MGVLKMYAIDTVSSLFHTFLNLDRYYYINIRLIWYIDILINGCIHHHDARRDDGNKLQNWWVIGPAHIYTQLLQFSH
ncbi:hypothetical protein Desgi_3705 [Desulfoscipio gibsoniae DSM 7213]|uniref:Uncharacterized protein n=1 Tax=Desulfoscipio gibsoniae DSM 7213 TaxID=767817 RepID=R4KN97_9FIRM|nr:hypothetical protein Desgi_3705 [Desulfoscipio gibsoniae DSM 7213]